MNPIMVNSEQRPNGERLGGTSVPTSVDVSVVMRRCSPEAVQAARAFHANGDEKEIATIVRGIIERYVEPGLRAQVRTGGAETRLVEDLGVDSLTMMEIVLLSEEVLKISIGTDELKGLRTLGDVEHFARCAVRGIPTHPMIETEGVASQ